MPGDSGGLVVTRSRVFFIAREAAGASGTRHSPHPLGWKDFEKLGRVAPRERGFVSDEHNTCTLRLRSSSPATGSRECAPDDRLLRAIQYSETAVLESISRSVLDTACAGYDGVAWGWCNVSAMVAQPVIPGCAVRRRPGIHN